MKSIGDRIREIREKKGWTQDDLANAADMNRVTIAKYEAGRIEPKSRSLQKLAAALEINANLLIDGESKMDDDDRELWELREKVRRDPERHYLFKLASNGTIDDVRRAVAIIDALKQTK
jgi:transcriptional regulator with XRE-family HTH domain